MYLPVLMTTLLVSLDGIKLGGVTEVVQARGIDRVIVVASGTQFNDFTQASTLNSVVAVRDAGAKVELAVNTGSTLSLSESAAQILPATAQSLHPTDQIIWRGCWLFPDQS